MIESIHDRARLAKLLRRDIGMNLYALGDLDDFFWPRTVWYALDGSEAVALLYLGTDTPTLLLFDGGRDGAALLDAVEPLLPAAFYAHLHPALVPRLAERRAFDAHGLHHKMILARPDELGAVDTTGVEAVAPGDLDELLALYADSYPGNWFDPRMLETHCYVGARRDGRLIACAGIHVYSPRHRVAALGNITTLPAFRGKGLGRAVTAACCQHLLRSVDVIGLNVKADNEAAIRCYRSLGFEHAGDYVEGAVSVRP